MHCDQQIREMSGESVINATGVFGNLSLTEILQNCKPDWFWVYPPKDNQSLIPRK